MAARREDYGLHVTPRVACYKLRMDGSTGARHQFQMTLPGTPRATNYLNQAKGGQWERRRQRNAWKALVSDLIRLTPNSKPAVPIEAFKIELVRYAPVFMDYDGLVASMKPIVDALVVSGVLANDNYARTGNWRVHQIKSKAEHARVEVCVFEQDRIGELSEVGIDDGNCPKCRSL